MRAEFAGDARQFARTVGAQPLLIVAALISVYIILGVLYESLAHPLTIISTLPSAGLGALLALMLFGTELTVIAFIGIILLIGIVKKNGIMLVDFALDAERRRGRTPEQAIREACLERFRPILMTTMAALLGAVPLILATGPGSELRRPLGITIIGGLLVSQVLTLYTTPVIYLMLDRLHRRLWGASPDRGAGRSRRRREGDRRSHCHDHGSAEPHAGKCWAPFVVVGEGGAVGVGMTAVRDEQRAGSAQVRWNAGILRSDAAWYKRARGEKEQQCILLDRLLRRPGRLRAR